MKVYIVLYDKGYGEDVYGVFTTEEKAEDFIRITNSLEEYPLPLFWQEYEVV